MKLGKEQQEAILLMQEMEKNRIARELHDTTVQNLTAMIHKIEYCTLIMDKDPIEAKLELQTMIGTIRSTVSEMRDIIYDLRPMSLDDLKLSETFKNYINHIQMDISCRIYFDLIGEETELMPVIKLNAFRLFQEAVNNALNHGKPDRIEVVLSYEEDVFRLMVKDNGCGFQVKEVKSENNFGLSIMQERAALLKGTLQINSIEDKGTEIILEVPLK